MCFSIRRGGGWRGEGVGGGHEEKYGSRLDGVPGGGGAQTRKGLLITSATICHTAKQELCTYITLTCNTIKIKK
jgi:hypothetical protein